MATPSLSDSEFVVGFCVGCAKDVLTHLDLGPTDDEVRRCLHCDEAINSALRSVRGDELEASGYALIEARSCGNGGGCSAGCGMRSQR